LESAAFRKDATANIREELDLADDAVATTESPFAA
jgi:hypothetical protein